jgi:hypothetical protein
MKNEVLKGWEISSQAISLAQTLNPFSKSSPNLTNQG